MGEFQIDIQDLAMEVLDGAALVSGEVVEMATVMCSLLGKAEHRKIGKTKHTSWSTQYNIKPYRRHVSSFITYVFSLSLASLLFFKLIAAAVSS